MPGIINPYLLEPIAYSGALTNLYFDGTDGSTTIIDETGRHNWSTSGSAQLDTTYKKFGSASLTSGANGYDVINAPYSNDWDIFGTYEGAHTMSFFYRFSTGQSTYPVFYNQTHSSPVGTALTFSVDFMQGIIFKFSINSSNKCTIATSTFPTVDTWQHYALIRVGTYVGVYLDGTRIGGNALSSLGVLDGSIYINPHQGNIDEFFITNTNHFSASPSSFGDTISVPTGQYT